MFVSDIWSIISIIKTGATFISSFNKKNLNFEIWREGLNGGH